MLLTNITINNYRGIKILTVDLTDTTVIIGENNTGKTTFLSSIRACLEWLKGGRNSMFTEYDFHLKDENSDLSQVDPIIIDIEFKELNEDEWSEDIIQVFNDVLVLNDDDTNSLRLRVTGNLNKENGAISQSWAFLDSKGEELVGKNSKTIGQLQKIRPVFYLTALRDASKEFSSRSSYWAPFLKNSNISGEQKIELEGLLNEVNSKIVTAHQPFAKIKSALGKVQGLIKTKTDSVVSIEAVPGKIFDMLGKTQVKIESSNGVKLPLWRHGEGTQSISVLLLFDAFLQAQLTESYGKLAKPIIALEEPEAHLHPCAIRTLYNTINELEGQKIIATHSGDLLTEVSIENIRRFYKDSSGLVKVGKIKEQTLDPKGLKLFNFHIRRNQAELLFANLWVLAEGETEVTLLNESSRLLGYDFHKNGTRCVPFRHANIEIFIKVANDLGINWILISDGDSQGDADVSKAKTLLNGKQESDVIFQFTDKDLDTHLAKNGFLEIYKSYISDQKRETITEVEGVGLQHIWDNHAHLCPNTT